MAFTRSLLIKALGGVAGVGGTTVGVLAGTGVFNKKEQSGNESLDSTKPDVSGEVDNKAGKVATEQEGSDAVSQERQTSDKTQKVDSGLQTGQENNKGNTQQNSQPGVQTAHGGGEHRSGSTSQISEPGSSNNPVQVEGANDVDPKQQPPSETETTTPPVKEKQRSPEVTESQQSTPSLPESPNRDSDGQGHSTEQRESGSSSKGLGSQQSEIENPTNSQLDGSGSSNSSPAPGTPAGQPSVDGGGSSLPNAGATPGAEDTHEPTTDDNDAAGEGESKLPDSSTTDPSSQSQEEKINAQLKTLGVPESCNFAKSDTSKTCSINKEELNKMKFNNGNSVSGSVENNVENLQLKIEILSGNKKTAYEINDDTDEEGESDVTKDLLFTFFGFNDEINLESEDGFILYPNTNPEFKAEGDELEKVWDQAVNLAEKIGFEKGQGNTNYSLKSGTTTLKYSLDGTEGSIKTLNSPTTSGTIEIQEDQDNYNQGVKVTFKEKVTGTGADSLEKGDYEIKYKDGENEGWYLSKKNKGTEGKAKGSQGADGEVVNNPEQPQQALQSGGSTSSDGLSSEQQLNNNQQDQVPTEDTNSHSKTDVSESTQTITENQDSRVNDVSDTVDNEEDTATDQQVKATNSKLEELNIPKKCRFTDSNKDEPLECSLSKDEFKEISFEDKEVDESLLEENGEPFVMKLIIERLSESKKTDYENDGKQVDLLFTFKDFKEKIENGCKRGFKVNKNLTLDENTNPEFEGNSENFKSLWGQPVDLAKKVGLSEASCNEKGSGCFKFDQKKSQSTKFSVDKGNTIKEVNIPEESQKKAKAFAEARGYSQGFRFLFKEAVTFENDNTLPAGGYEIVYKNDSGWYLSQVSTDTAENWNEQDSDGNPCVSEEE